MVVGGWKHLTGQIVGLPLDTFHNSVAQWHSSGFYIMAAAAAGQIFVFHVGTGKVETSSYNLENFHESTSSPHRCLVMTCPERLMHLGTSLFPKQDS